MRETERGINPEARGPGAYDLSPPDERGGKCHRQHQSGGGPGEAQPQAAGPRCGGRGEARRARRGSSPATVGPIGIRPVWIGPRCRGTRGGRRCARRRCLAGRPLMSAASTAHSLAAGQLRVRHVVAGGAGGAVEAHLGPVGAGPMVRELADGGNRPGRSGRQRRPIHRRAERTGRIGPALQVPLDDIEPLNAVSAAGFAPSPPASRTGHGPRPSRWSAPPA